MENIVVAFCHEGSADSTYVLIGYNRAVQLAIESDAWEQVDGIVQPIIRRRDSMPMLFRSSSKWYRLLSEILHLQESEDVTILLGKTY